MASVNLGRVGLVLRGDWSATTNYVPLDVVTYNGNSFAAKAASINTLPTNTTYWQPLAQNSEYIAQMEEYLAQAQEYAETAEESSEAAAKALANQADVYSNQSTYSAGDYVLYDGVLYRCLNPITAPENWTPANWETIKVGGALPPLQNDTNNLKNDIGTPFSTTADYSSGDFVMYNGILYRFTESHPAGAWTGGDVSQVSIAGEVGELKSALSNYSDGIDTFANYTDFKACGLFRGNNVASEKYRASSQSVLMFDKDINLTIADGFTIRLNTFVNGAFSSETAWQTGTYQIRKNTYFKIVIAKVPEDTSSTADVPVFVNAVKFDSYIGGSLDKYEYGWGNLFSGENIPVKYLGRFRRGGISDNGAVSVNTTYRVCSTDIVDAERNLVVSVTDNLYAFAVYFYDGNGTYLSKSEWIRNTYHIDKGSHFRILIGKRPEQESLKADPEEFARAIGVDSYLSGLTNQFSQQSLSTQADLVKGTFQNGTLNSTESRRARTGFIFSNGYSKLTVTPNNDYYWVVGGSDVIDNVLQNYYDVVPTWNHSEQEILLQPGIYVITVANGATYSQSTNYDIANPSIRFEIQSLNYSETLKAITQLIDAKDELPSYWQTYMETKLPAIQAQVRESAMTGDSFVFLTDYHVEHNSGKSHLLIKDIIDHTPIHKVVFGGDIYNGSSTKEESIAKCQTFMDRFHGLPVFGIRGNHEYNLNDGGSANVKFTENDIYNFIVKPCEDKIRSSGKMYYYNDNEPQKIRYIFLDTKNITGTDPTEAAIDQEQLDWFVEQLQSLESDWNVVIFVHDFWARTNGVWNPSADGEAIENAISSSNTDATICAIICGHVHLDYSAERNGIQCIATTWDGYYASTGRNLGTTTELAFDVFTIDTNAKTIKASRVGYGEDRTWTYGN